MSGLLQEQFERPPVDYRGKPFWSWNGELRQEELIRQIGVLKEMGFGGFFMHSRTGLATEYMGEEWMKLINACADEAERLGMEAWLYDEDRWPSGTAGGLVTREPDYRRKFIRLRVSGAEAFIPPQDPPLALFECALDGLAASEVRQLADGERPAPGRWALCFTVEEQASESFYNGYTYVDTMNREAVDRFIELTHEAYKNACGDRLGRSIKGIFTDEPHRGALLDGFGLANPDPEWLAPWTASLFERFRERFGYDLAPRLPELFLQIEGRAVSQVKWHYAELLTELFMESFAKPIGDWCEANGIALTGHTLHEDSLTAQTAMVGSVMRFYEHMSHPGVDVLTEGNVDYWIVKQLSSAARQLGRPWLMSELYGCTGWQMTLQGHKAVGDWQALLGINLRCHHLSWYTMAGEAKRDYPASIFYQSAWWRQYETVETYYARLGLLLSQGEPACELLVVHPVESVWCQTYPDWSRGLSAVSPAVRELERKFEALYHLLAGERIDFDYGDEEMMSRLACVETGEDGTPRLRVGRAVYRAVLVSGMTTIRSDTLRLLERFAAAGGRVVFAGEAPAYVDALPSEWCAGFADGGQAIRCETAELAALLRAGAGVGAIVSAQGAGGEPLPGIHTQVRRLGGRTIVVLMNMDRTNELRDVTIRLPAPVGGGGAGCPGTSAAGVNDSGVNDSGANDSGANDSGANDSGTNDLVASDLVANDLWASAAAVEEWNCLTGERFALEAFREGNALVLTTDFPPSGERVFVVSDGRAVPEETLPAAVRLADAAEMPLQGPFAYALEEPNVCVLDRAEWRLDDGEWRPAEEVLRIDAAARRERGLPLRAGDMIQPWYRRKYLAESAGERARLSLRFAFDAAEIPQGELYLAAERPELLEIKLNGIAIDTSAPEGWWIDPCFVKLRIAPAQLRQGGNLLEVSADLHADFDLENLYLLGGFGVVLNGTQPTLTRLPERLEAGDILGQGLPFYGGAITYRISREEVARVAATLGTAHAGGELYAAFGEGAAAIVVREAEAGTDAGAGGEAQTGEAQTGEAQHGEAQTGDAQTRRHTGAHTVVWHPYEVPISGESELEVKWILTRRNTFGPLHQLPVLTPYYAPSNWLTEGAAYSEAYALVPAGMAEPRLRSKLPAQSRNPTGA
ncbi:glycosyl hydrolase [Cohnella hashimotonis]|uniref:Glycosyl hydrolase n=1 Tax=Cohnella hashimotonis TaxID=2826895 RepID=A0ABT6TPC2_9BACL|nr:glycosyl hydrolase [Cohnella hashimotonis]MDI4648145.1 glycosyl hydrolase [Cohnella hashimotonis]